MDTPAPHTVEQALQSPTFHRYGGVDDDRDGDAGGDDVELAIGVSDLDTASDVGASSEHDCVSDLDTLGEGLRGNEVVKPGLVGVTEGDAEPVADEGEAEPVADVVDAGDAECDDEGVGIDVCVNDCDDSCVLLAGRDRDVDGLPAPDIDGDSDGVTDGESDHDDSDITSKGG